MDRHNGWSLYSGGAVRHLRIKGYALVVLAIAVGIAVVIKVFDTRFINPWTFVVTSLVGLGTGLAIRKHRRKRRL